MGGNPKNAKYNIYIYIPRTQMTSIFEGQPLKTKPFPTKTRVIWVPGIYKVTLKDFSPLKSCMKFWGGWFRAPCKKKKRPTDQSFLQFCQACASKASAMQGLFGGVWRVLSFFFLEDGRCFMTLGFCSGLSGSPNLDSKSLHVIFGEDIICGIKATISGDVWDVWG